MKTILNNAVNHPPADVVMHAIKNYATEDHHSEKSIVAVLKEINASIKIEEALKRKTRNGGYVAWPKTIS